MIENNYIGIMDGVKDEIYHSKYLDLPALGSSQIKIALKSIHAFNEIVIKGRAEEKKQYNLDFGKFSHKFILEDKKDEFVCGPNASKLTKEWKEFCANYPEKTVLTNSEYIKLCDMKNEMDSNEVASNLILSSHIERAYFCITNNHIWVKGKPDGVHKQDVSMFDYKTASSVDERNFTNSVEQYGYHISAAHYIECHKNLFEKDIEDYFFIVQEKTLPYEVKIFKADKSMLSEGKRLLDIALSKIEVLKKEYFQIKKEYEEISIISLPYWSKHEGLIAETEIENSFNPF